MIESMVPPERSFLSWFLPAILIGIVLIQSTRVSLLTEHIYLLDRSISSLAKELKRTVDDLGQTADTDHKLADGLTSSASGLVSLSRSVDSLQLEIGAIMKVLGTHKQSIEALQGFSVLKRAPDEPLYFEFSAKPAHEYENSAYSDPAKPWNAAMCRVAQKPTVSEEYIAFCMRESEKWPVCAITLPPHKEPVYFEVLDCSWHSGENPRVKDHAGLR